MAQLAASTTGLPGVPEPREQGIGLRSAKDVAEDVVRRLWLDQEEDAGPPPSGSPAK